MIAYNNNNTLIELGGKTTSMYGVCSTASNVAAKTVTIQNFASLQPGASIRVKFNNANSAGYPTLQVNNTAAKPIYIATDLRPGSGSSISWIAGEVIEFTYDGTNWMMENVTASEGAMSKKSYIVTSSSWEFRPNAGMYFSRLTLDPRLTEDYPPNIYLAPYSTDDLFPSQEEKEAFRMIEAGELMNTSVEDICYLTLYAAAVPCSSEGDPQSLRIFVEGKVLQPWE